MPELTMEDFKRITVNPFYCINIDDGLFGDHEPLISKNDWVEIMVRNITEDDDGNRLPESLIDVSIKEWMLRLLDVLEGNYII